MPIEEILDAREHVQPIRCPPGTASVPHRVTVRIEETAEVLKVSPATIKREWSLAQAWLYRELKRGEG